MSTDDIDHQRERAARNQALFRQVNNRIEELVQRFQLEAEGFSCVCECADVECAERIEVPHDEYERIRRRPTEFIVKPGHELPEVEEVVHRESRWVIVRKIGAAAEVAEKLAGSGNID